MNVGRIACVAVLIAVISLFIGVETQHQIKEARCEVPSQSYRDAVVPIYFKDPQGKFNRIGTGVTVGNGVLSTARHVVSMEVEYFVGQDLRPVTEVRTHKTKDLAIIVANTDGWREFEVSETGPLQIGQELWTIGIPGPYQQFATKGIYQGEHQTDPNADNKYWKEFENYIIYATNIAAGMSGGAVIACNGTVVGTITAVGVMNAGGGFMSIRVPLSWIGLGVPSRFLKDIDDGLHINYTR
jgi:S1-C subfamily serine protease